MVSLKIEQLMHNLKTNEVTQSSAIIQSDSEEQLWNIMEIFDSGLYSQGYKDVTPKTAETFVKYEKHTNNAYFRVIISE